MTMRSLLLLPVLAKAADFSTGSRSCELHEGKNNGGTNLKQVKGLSGAEACCDACTGTAGCVGFTWVNWQSQCWLKDNVDGLTNDDGVTSGYMGPAPPAPPPAPTVMVFGDSWGDYGPSFREIQDTFARHGADHDVRSAAKGGTTACGWAKDPQAIVKATQQKFPELPDGPDFLWYTAGGNDMGDDGEFHSCSGRAQSIEDNFACMQTATDKIIACTRTMFDEFFKAYPKTKVMQCNYDAPCENQHCRNWFTHGFMGSYCGDNITCLDSCSLHWEEIYVGKLKTIYKEPQYTGLLIGGAVQKAAGVPGADVGKPVLGVGGPCDMMAQCIHPKYGTAASEGVGEAFWDLFFSKYVSAAWSGAATV